MKDLQYTLGLDIGSATIGWAVIEIQKENEYYRPVRLIDTGVRVFEAGVNAGDKHPNQVRREARSSRRVVRRRKYRIKKLKKALDSFGFPTEFDNFDIKKHDPWFLRCKALDERLTDEELARVLIHIVKRRGFKSNRKNIALEGEEGGKLAENISKNQELLKNYRTVGEMFYKDEEFKFQKRNRRGNYKRLVTRKMLEDELKEILKKQKKFGNKKITEDFENKILEIFNYQRPFAQTDDIEKMVGKCGIFPNESRAPVHSINFEIFRFFNFLQNNIKVFNTKTGELRPLNQSELDKIYDHIFSHSSNISYYHIRKWAEIPEEYSFRDVDASKEKEKIKGLKPLSGYHKLRKAIKDRNGDLWEKITNDFNLYEQIVYGLTVRKTDEDLKDYFEGISQLSPQEVETLVNYGPNLSGFANLSVKAYKELAQIIRKEGENYTHAEEILRSKYPNETLKLKRNFTKLPPFTSSSVTNPVVKKVISQTRKVINAIVDKYGSPSFVNIELARDLAKSEDEKRKITKNLEEITKGKEKIKKFLEENFDYFKTKEVTPHDILKYELREEQLGKCLLSDKEIPAEKLFEDNYVEIDHALPYSRSFDDSRNNKILVLTSVNRKKGNSTPFEYFGGDENSEQWQNFVNFVNSLNINTSKKNKILNTTLPKDVPPEEFLNRNLNDTQFAARTIKNYVENNLKFRETPGKKRKVYVITGAMTNYLLKMYGLPKNRDLNARHHAVDATLVGITTPWMIQKMNEWHKNDKENFYKRKKSFPNPWPNFRNDVLIRVFGTQKPQKMDSKEQNGEINSEFWKYKKSDDFLKLYKDIKNKIKPLIVSREPKRKIRGAAHLETVYSQRGVTEKGLSILGTRKQIDLSKESKDLNNSLEKIYKNTDPAYYKAVNKAINEKRKLEPDEPLTWKDPNKKSPIFSYISETVENNTVKLKRGNGYGYVLNSRIVRTDVFKKDGKYYLVPIYLPEIMSGELPNKVITINTPKSDWQELDDTYEFQFSLYKNDFIKIKVKKDDDYYLSGYFIGVDSSNARISFVKHDNVGSKGYIRKGSKNLYLIEKYQVDVLGRLYKVHKETRQPIILK